MGCDARDVAPGALVIPPWVPDAVSKAARALNPPAGKGDDNPIYEVLKRLLVDQRMRRVWRELTKQKKDSATTFVHSAKLTWDFDNAADRQDTAIASLLYLAVNLAISDPTVMTRREVEVQRRRFLDKTAAAFVQGDVAAARDHEVKAADWAAAAATRTRLVVERDTGDSQARCFAILFADQCRRIFGSPLYGVTATVASVALGRKLTARAVRNWVQYNSLSMPIASDQPMQGGD
jgi:hypothetical protein